VADSKLVAAAAGVGMTLMSAAPLVAIVALTLHHDRTAVTMIAVFILGGMAALPWVVAERARTILLAASVANKAVELSNPALAEAWSAPIQVEAVDTSNDNSPSPTRRDLLS
jgi:Na+(H+)/acetate symporter ActP